MIDALTRLFVVLRASRYLVLGIFGGVLLFAIASLSSTQSASAAAPTYSLMDSSPTSPTPFIPDHYSQGVDKLELGIKVSTTAAGSISAVRFYKEPESTASHEAHIWDSSGQLLATQAFTSETASGWQEVQLATPVQIPANSTFVVSVYSTAYYFPGSTFQTMTSGPLTVIGGVYSYSGNSLYPSNVVNYQYGVDFLFTKAGIDLPCSVSGSYQIIGTHVIWDGVYNHSCSGSITIPAYVTAIDPDALDGDWSLTSVAFEAGSLLTSIGYEAFYNDVYLTDVTLPAGLQTIDTNAFGTDSNINSISIPDTVASIGNVALSYLSKVTSIVLPTGLTSFTGIPLNGTPLTSATYCGSLSAVTSYMATTFPSINVQAACTAQSISFTSSSPTTASSGGATYAITATGGASGNPIVLGSSTPTVCTLASNVLSFISAGTCTVTADQAPHLNFLAAPQATQSFSVGAALILQSITFGALTGVNFGVTPFTLTATTSSTLPISYSSTTSSICSVTLDQVTILQAGTCSITASQAGDPTYSAALPIAQSFLVAQVDQPALLLTSASGYSGVPLSLSTSGGAGSGAVTYSLSSAGSANCSLNGTTLLNSSAIGDCQVIATKAGDTNYLSVLSSATTVVFTVDPAVLAAQQAAAALAAKQAAAALAAKQAAAALAAQQAAAALAAQQAADALAAQQAADALAAQQAADAQIAMQAADALIAKQAADALIAKQAADALVAKQAADALAAKQAASALASKQATATALKAKEAAAKVAAARALAAQNVARTEAPSNTAAAPTTTPATAPGVTPAETPTPTPSPATVKNPFRALVKSSGKSTAIMSLQGIKKGSTIKVTIKRNVRK